QPGGADRHLTGADPQRDGQMLRGRVGVLEAGRAGAGVGAAGVEHHGAYPAGPQHLPAPPHRRRLYPVGGEHRGRVEPRTVVDDERHVPACRLEPGGNASEAETPHGATPCAVRPAVSGRPSIRLAHCTACPAAPLPRLSIAAITMIRPLSPSTVDCRWTALDPSVAPVAGHTPSGSSRTNGSPA